MATVESTAKLLTAAVPTRAAARISLFGPDGSGKTLTSALIAVGISKERHKSAPVALADPEGISDFLIDIFAAEGVPLVTMQRSAFVDMRDGLREAEQAHCCVYVVDHYDRFFAELTQAQKTALNLNGRRLPYHQREELARIWDAWVTQFSASSCHTIFNGRLAFEWGDNENDEGEIEKIKLGTKQRGHWDAGYEPDLQIELERVDDQAKRHKKTRSKAGTISHWLHILKDRRMILNGRHFEFKDLNQYQQGDYAKVYAAVRPHIDALSPATVGDRGDERPSEPRTSVTLFSATQSESQFAERKRLVTVAMEEIDAALSILWGGSAVEAKQSRLAALEALFQMRSQSAIEAKPFELVQLGMGVLRECVSLVDNHEEMQVPVGRAAVLAWVLAVKDRMQSEAVL